MRLLLAAASQEVWWARFDGVLVKVLSVSAQGGESRVCEARHFGVALLCEREQHIQDK